MKTYDKVSAFPKILKNATYGKIREMTWAEACKRGSRMFAVMSEMFRELGETLDRYEPLLQKVWETPSERSMSSVARDIRDAHSKARKVFHPYQGLIGGQNRCEICGLLMANHVNPPSMKRGVLEMMLEEERWCNCQAEVFAVDGSGLIHEESCRVVYVRNQKREELMKGGKA